MWSLISQYCGNKQCGRRVQPTRYAPPTYNDTGTEFGLADMRRTNYVSLWPWPLILKLVFNVARVVEYSSANFDDTTTVCFRFMGYWALRASTACRYRSIGYSCKLLLLTRSKVTNDTVFGDKILDLESESAFRQLGSVTMLRVPH